MENGSMRILLQRTEDNLFFAENQCWVANRQNALDFAHTVDALMAAHHVRCEVVIRLAFDDPHWDVCLKGPLKEEQTTKGTCAIHPVTSNVPF